MRYIVVSGNPIDGFHFRGPFDDEDDAREWAEQHCKGDWWVAPLTEAQ